MIGNDVLDIGEHRRGSIATAFGTLAVLALALRLACTTGLIGSDDLQYSYYAQAIDQGGYSEAIAQARGRSFIHWAVRYGLLLPQAGIYRIAGVSEWSTIALPLVASTFSVLLLAQIGRRLFDWRVGLIAGLLYATFPLQLRYATILVPEPIAECFALLGVLCYLEAPRRQRLWYFVAGIAFGAAYLSKESALFIGGAFLLHALWDREWRGLLLLGAGLAGVMALEHAYYLVGQGDLLFRPHATVLSRPGYSDQLGPSLIYRWLVPYPRRMLIPNVSFGLHSVACLAGGALALLLRPKKGYALLLLWAVVPWLYLNFGSSSLTRYVVLPTQFRYIEFTYPPLMLLTAVLVSRVWTVRGHVAAAATAALTVVCAVGVACGLETRATGFRTAEMAVLRQVAARAAAETDARVYTTNVLWRRALGILDASVLAPSPDAASFTLEEGPLGLPALRPVPAGAEEARELP